MLKRIVYILLIVVSIATPTYYFIQRSLAECASVQVGQTWLFEREGEDHSDDPFKEPRKTARWTVKVVDIKDGYVQYEYDEHSGCSSTSIGKFLMVFDFVRDPNSPITGE